MTDEQSDSESVDEYELELCRKMIRAELLKSGVIFGFILLVAGVGLFAGLWLWEKSGSDTGMPWPIAILYATGGKAAVLYFLGGLGVLVWIHAGYCYFFRKVK